jgi:hypothetical protein
MEVTENIYLKGHQVMIVSALRQKVENQGGAT